jgi:hypothetical protein
MDQAFIEEASLQPVENEQTAGQTWTVASNAGDRFVFRELRQSGPEARYATYFSYWVYSPIDLGDLLNAGPDLPEVTQLCYVSDHARVYLNGTPLQPARSEGVDYRTLLVFEHVPLEQGWNQFMVKCASDSLKTDDPGTLAVRLFSTHPSYDKQLKSAVQAKR